jgi:D-amino peptidase
VGTSSKTLGRHGRKGKFLVWVDMEGVSQIADYRECLPVFSEYWKTGRAKMTADAAAAASGLLSGGAEEVLVIDGHGLGWPNLMNELLPDGAKPYGYGGSTKSLDGLLFLGFHARCGTADGFMSHTFVPYLHVAVNGVPITECHAYALGAGLPVLGVVGDATLGHQLDGALEGTPFLGVKTSSSRTNTVPSHQIAEGSTRAIEDFARECAKSRLESPPPAVKSPFSLSVSMPRELTNRAEGAGGLRRRGPSVLEVKAQDWGSEADPAVNAAMGAAVAPLLEVIGGMDFSGEDAVARAGSKRLEAARRYFAKWIEGDFPGWGQ